MSRRALVQAKRKRLGLPVNGKLAPYVYSAQQLDLRMCQWTQEELRFKPTRKESYKAAIEADRIIRQHPYWIEEDVEAHRQRIIKNWMRWQMVVSHD